MVDERRLDRNDMRERAAGSAKTIVLDPSALTMAGGRFIEATSDTQRRLLVSKPAADRFIAHFMRLVDCTTRPRATPKVSSQW